MKVVWILVQRYFCVRNACLLQTKLFPPLNVCAKFVEQDQIPGFGLTSNVHIASSSLEVVFSSVMLHEQECVGESLNFYPFKQLF